MQLFYTGGGLGDSYVTICKLIDIKDDIKIIHAQPFPKLNNNIKKIFSLIPNVVELKIENRNFEFIEPYIYTYARNYPDEPESINMNYFPNFEFESSYNFDFPYIVLQPKSGREEQNREIRMKTIRRIIKNSKYKVILIGTSKKYEKIKDCINLVNKTTLFDAFNIIKNSKYFIGHFGIMVMFALSHKVNCSFLTFTIEELLHRVYDNPWEQYCKKVILQKQYIDMQTDFFFKLKILLFNFYKRLIKKIRLKRRINRKLQKNESKHLIIKKDSSKNLIE